MLALVQLSLFLMLTDPLYFAEFVESYSCSKTSLFFPQLNPPPAFLAERITLFERLKTEYDAQIEGTKVYLTVVCMTVP